MTSPREGKYSASSVAHFMLVAYFIGMFIVAPDLIHHLHWIADMCAHVAVSP